MEFTIERNDMLRLKTFFFANPGQPYIPRATRNKLDNLIKEIEQLNTKIKQVIPEGTSLKDYQPKLQEALDNLSDMPQLLQEKHNELLKYIGNQEKINLEAEDLEQELETTIGNQEIFEQVLTNITQLNQSSSLKGFLFPYENKIRKLQKMTSDIKKEVDNFRGHSKQILKNSLKEAMERVKDEQESYAGYSNAYAIAEKNYKECREKYDSFDSVQSNILASINNLCLKRNILIGELKTKTPCDILSDELKTLLQDIHQYTEHKNTYNAMILQPDTPAPTSP